MIFFLILGMCLLFLLLGIAISRISILLRSGLVLLLYFYLVLFLDGLVRESCDLFLQDVLICFGVFSGVILDEFLCWFLVDYVIDRCQIFLRWQRLVLPTCAITDLVVPRLWRVLWNLQNI